MAENNTVVMHERDITKTSKLQLVKGIASTCMKYLFLIIVAVLPEDAGGVPSERTYLLAQTSYVVKLRRSFHCCKPRNSL